MRLIDADAFERDTTERYCSKCDSYNGVRCRACWVDDMQSEVEDAPTIDAEPVRHGRWIKRYEGLFDCSSCGVRMDLEGTPEEYLMHHCPNCGANMEEDK